MASVPVEPIELKKEKLHQLADIVYRKEVLAIYDIQFKSEHERSKYLYDCLDNKTKIEDMLKSADDAKNEHLSDQVKDPIAHDLYHYSVKGVNVALQTIKNYTVRQAYLTKIKGHAEELLSVLKTLGPQDVANARALAETAAYFKDATANFFEKSQSFYSSKTFSKLVKERGIKFPDLIREYQARLGFEGNFKDLTNAQKLKVYNEIIGESGRGKIVLEVIDTTLAAAGIALLVFSMGTMVWDIFTAERPLEVATKNAMTLAAGLGGAAIGSVVKAAIPSLVDEVEISTVFLECAGFITSVAGGFIITAVAGLLLDLIFHSGGETPPPNLTDGHICFVAPLPDGAALAHELVHGNPSN
ncbi:uncharacterized protein LOC109828830 [Asparagus officinalis]|uniref:uncharacterized protein LOC109828830 n=1 Tax=Asparagus officinalis TaxID=4686 RepID=UPI00098E4A6D|nr:uncharacterized protein LOC109828830 [Asparagus officinalis]